MDPHINPQTGVWDDNYFAQQQQLQRNAGNAGNGGGGSPTDQAMSLMNQTIQAWTNQANQYNKKYNDYTNANPDAFNFDKILADQTKQVKSRLDPYYQQTLGDFMTGINLKKTRSLEDNQKLLGELNLSIDRYTAQQKGQLGAALESTGSSFASNGLYDSGARQNAQGQLQAATNENIQNYSQPLQNQMLSSQIATKRLAGQDIPLATSIEQRNLNQEEAYNTQAQAYTGAQQQLGVNEYNRQQAAGNPPGVNPVNYQNSVSNILTG